MATNVLAPFLFAQCLAPVLLNTAFESAGSSVRLTWSGSIAVDVWSPSGGMTFDIKNSPICHTDSSTNYGATKAANIMLASEFAKRYPPGESNIITNAWNPGKLKTELQRQMDGLNPGTYSRMLYDVRNGACTALFAGWSDEAGRVANNAKYIWPWG